MSRRHTSNGYEDQLGSDRADSRDQRNIPDPRDALDPRYTRESREPPTVRELPERRYSRQPREYAGPREPEERAEMRVASGRRSSRRLGGPRYDHETRINTGETDRIVIHPRERTHLDNVSDHRGIGPFRDVPNPPDNRRDLRDVEYHQSRRRGRREIDDTGHSGREEWDERQIQSAPVYQRNDQPPTIRGNTVQNLDVLPQSEHTPGPAISSMGTPSREYFLPAQGINLEVLTSHLGPNAVYQSARNREVRPLAYLTSQDHY
jgi:hypothetical protein